MYVVVVALIASVAPIVVAAVAVVSAAFAALSIHEPKQQSCQRHELKTYHKHSGFYLETSREEED